MVGFEQAYNLIEAMREVRQSWFNSNEREPARADSLLRAFNSTLDEMRPVIQDSLAALEHRLEVVDLQEFDGLRKKTARELVLSVAERMGRGLAAAASDPLFPDKHDLKFDHDAGRHCCNSFQEWLEETRFQELEDLFELEGRRIKLAPIRWHMLTKTQQHIMQFFEREGSGEPLFQGQIAAGAGYKRSSSSFQDDLMQLTQNDFGLLFHRKPRKGYTVVTWPYAMPKEE